MTSKVSNTSNYKSIGAWVIIQETEIPEKLAVELLERFGSERKVVDFVQNLGDQ